MSAEFIESMDPGPADMVDAPQVPAVPGWTWTPNRLAVAGLVVLGVCVGVYFVLSYTSEKNKAQAAKAASNDG